MKFAHAAATSAAVTAVLTLTGCGTDSSSTAASPATPTAEAGSAGQPPWSAPVDVAPLVAAAGLDLGPMGMAEHYHPRLRVFINDREVPVAANIGVDPATGAMSAVHTHEGDGTIHIEADAKGETFTLGQVFAQWDVELTATRIGGVTARPGQAVRVTSNGNPVDGDPNRLRLRPEQQIEVRLG